MKLNLIKCDGCDSTVPIDDGAARYWFNLTLQGMRGTTGEAHVQQMDLCPSCGERANPRRWPRVAPPETKP